MLLLAHVLTDNTIGLEIEKDNKVILTRQQAITLRAEIDSALHYLSSRLIRDGLLTVSEGR